MNYPFQSMPMDTDTNYPEPATILVVDDTPANLSLMTGLLRDTTTRSRPRSMARRPCASPRPPRRPT